MDLYILSSPSSFAYCKQKLDSVEGLGARLRVNLTVLLSSTQDVTEQDELIVMYRFYYHMEIERYSIIQISKNTTLYLFIHSNYHVPAQFFIVCSTGTLVPMSHPKKLFGV